MILYTTSTGLRRTITITLVLLAIFTQAHQNSITSPPTVTLTDNPTLLKINQGGAAFGVSTASAGDVNGDGYADVLVGASLYSENYTNEGAAFLYLGGPAGLSTTPAWRITGGQNQATLGQVVSGAGDINNDGYDDILIGAPKYDLPGQLNTGNVWLFTGSASGPASSPVQQLTITQSGALFGTSLAGIGDINHDGYADIAIGAYQPDTKAGTNAIYIYHGSATLLPSVPTTTLHSPQTDISFGYLVAKAGDINGDGYDDILTGDPYYKSNTGIILVYAGSDTGIRNTPLQQLDGTQPGALFGSSASTAGDVNGDGYNDIAIGAPHYSHDQDQEGAVWIYQGSRTGLIPIKTLESNNPMTSFGTSVSCAGDVNHDSFTDLIIGAPMQRDKNGLTNGAAFLYLGGPKGITDIPTRIYESSEASARYGNSVTGTGDTNGDGYDDYLVGAFQYSQGSQSRQGAAFLYPGGTGTLPVHLKTFTSRTEDCNVILSWQTDLEKNFLYYTIESSPDGVTFTPVNEIKPNTTGTYLYTLTQPSARVYYRLKITDINGLYTYSPLTTAQTTCTHTDELSIMLYPNPASSHLYISGLTQTEASQITLYDHHQRAIWHQTLPPLTQPELDVSTFPAGTYTVHINTTSTHKTGKLVIAH